MRTVVLSVGVGPERYLLSASRLRKSLKRKGFRGHAQIWQGDYPKGSPRHEEIPYAFKAHAFEWAYMNGYNSAIWIDTNLYAHKPIDSIINHVNEKGYLILLNGWTTGEWSTDEQLAAFGYSRDEAMQIPQAMACVIGLNFYSEDGMNIFQLYRSNTHLFKGSWKNDEGQVSSDPRVLGSRHDQTVLSLIAYSNGYDFTPPNGIVTYDQEQKDAILISAGM